jgi:hypothetical protein
MAVDAGLRRGEGAMRLKQAGLLLKQGCEKTAPSDEAQPSR